QADQGFPKVEGVRYNGRMHTGDLFDYGPQFAEGILTVLPPRMVGTPYPALVPKTDADGNDIAGIRLPEAAVPTATYTDRPMRERGKPRRSDDSSARQGPDAPACKCPGRSAARCRRLAYAIVLCPNARAVCVVVRCRPRIAEGSDRRLPAH